MCVADSRSGKRFSLQLPIRIQQANSRRGHRAVTHDLSAAGVFITANLPFREGAKVKFEITVPGSVIGALRNVELKCAGRVVRVDSARKGKHRGVACVIDRYRFVRRRTKGEPAC